MGIWFGVRTFSYHVPHSGAEIRNGAENRKKYLPPNSIFFGLKVFFWYINSFLVIIIPTAPLFSQMLLFFVITFVSPRSNSLVLATKLYFLKSFSFFDSFIFIFEIFDTLLVQERQKPQDLPPDMRQGTLPPSQLLIHFPRLSMNFLNSEVSWRSHFIFI